MRGSLPAGCSRISLPAASPAVPFGAETVPLLVTERPTRIASPVFEVMVPALITSPFDVPLAVIAPPAMKSLLEMSRVEATKLPFVTTLPPGPMTTPCGLIR